LEMHFGLDYEIQKYIPDCSAFSDPKRVSKFFSLEI